MERIIIREVDNTSNVEALSSYDVAYVPGFSNGPQDGSDMSTLYRTPTLVRDKYEFVQKFGASTPVFATDQNYPKQSAGTAGFTEDANKWGDMSVSYTALTTNFFGSIANAVDSGYYNQVTVVPISIDSGTTYYSVANYQGSYTLQKLTGTESDIIAAILDIVGKTYYTLRYDTLPEGQTIFNPDVDYYEGPDEDSDSDVDLTFTLTTDTEPQSNKTYYTLSDIQVFSDSVFYPDGTYFDKLTINPEPIDLNDSTKYFRDKLIKLYAHKAEVAYCSSYNDNEVINGDALIFIDKLSENDVFIELTGWCCPDRKINTDKLIIKLTGKENDINYFYTSTKKRFDVDEYTQKEKGWCAGFSTYIGKNHLKEKEYFVNFLFKDYSGKTICYSMEHILLI